MEDSPYENLDIGYYEFPLPTTEEHQTVRFLNKIGLARLWQKMADKFLRIPTGGTTGQALVKTESGTIAWGDVAADIPEIIPVENGGTGCTTIDGIRTMLFNFPADDELDEYMGS